MHQSLFTWTKAFVVAGMSILIGGGAAFADNFSIGLVQAYATWGDTDSQLFANNIQQGHPGAFDHPQTNDDELTFHPSGTSAIQWSKTNYYGNSSDHQSTTLGIKVYYDTQDSDAGSADGKYVRWEYSGSYTMSEYGTYSMAINGYDFKRTIASASLDGLSITMTASHDGDYQSSHDDWGYTTPAPSGLESRIEYDDLAVGSKIDWTLTIDISGSNNLYGYNGDSLGGIKLGQNFLPSNEVVPGPFAAASLAFMGLARRRRKRSGRG